MSKFLLFFTLIILFIYYSFSAEKWVYISGDGKSNVYYDEQSVLYDRIFNSYTVYFKYENLNLDTLSNGKVLTSQYLLYNFYCTRKQSLLLEIKAVYSDSTYEFISPARKTNSLSPDSPEEKVFESLCK